MGKSPSDYAALTLLLSSLMLVPTHPLHAQPDTTPEVVMPFPGDPRLEPLPGGPVNLSTFAAIANGLDIRIATPPRVNGQTQSDGDQHADLFVLFDAVTGDPILQPPVLEAVPIGAAPGVTDLTARLASSVWQVHAVTVLWKESTEPILPQLQSLPTDSSLPDASPTYSSATIPA